MYGMEDVVHEGKYHWVLCVPQGKLKGTYEVYRTGFTHATRVGVIGLRGGGGLDRAKTACKKRDTDLEAKIISESKRKLSKDSMKNIG